MKTIGTITIGMLITAATMLCRPALAASTSELLQQGLYAEEVEGNMDSAVKIYGQVIKESSAQPNQIAQALYRQGMCYLKLKDESSARADLEKLIADYPGQTDLVQKARPVLDDLTDFDPASLMPPGTLAYVEFGSPGRQIETILTMLKGTPFENPLAVIAGNAAGNSNQKSPGDIVGALLNPSMMAEFKKIRSSAVGITGIAPNTPSISVLYPGKSDALRGLILAGLGMAGKPGDPIEGMQTVNISAGGGGLSVAVAYDDRVIIAAQPASQLEWSVKQYKGVIKEPTLASSNKSFAKLSKAKREKNTLTVWANVAECYSRVLQMFPGGQIPHGLVAANAIVDFKSINEFTLTQSLEPNGLEWNAGLDFADGHHCLAYDLIHTPNINKAALGSVPADAIAVASFAMSQTDSAQTEAVRSGIQNITGLDIGREIFANIGQVTVFALPLSSDASDAEKNEFLPNHLGLAITSKNPAQTRQLLDTVLGAANSVLPNAGKSAPGEYKLHSMSGRDLSCYLDQVNGVTLLSLNQSVVSAAADSIRSHKSVCDSGALNREVSKLAPSASKLLLANIGGVLRLMGPQMLENVSDAEQLKQVNASLDQLAQAASSTVLEFRTDEQPNEFSLDALLSGIPPLNQILGPVSKISSITKAARAEATTKRLREEAPATIIQTPKPPALDGSADGSWKNAHTFNLENVLLGTPKSPDDLSANYKTMWDSDNLYLLVDVTDDILRHDSTPDNWYQDDSVEVYIDATDGKASEYDDSDYQFAFNWDKTTPALQETKHQRTSGVQYAMVKTDKGYRLAAKFPWSTLGTKPGAGTKIGFEVQVNDNDSGKRDHKIAWHAQEDNAWQNPQAFGNAELSDMSQSVSTAEQSR